VNKLKTLIVMTLFLTGAAGVAWGVAGLAGAHFSAAADASAQVHCSGKHPNHLVIIKGDKATPQHTAAPRCDSLTISNEDNEIRLIAFGPHEHHVAYDGVTERALGPNQSLTITLNAAGTYNFHDHLHDEMTGEFTVSP
jgi:plastocyanin